MPKLNLGSGIDIREGYINIDMFDFNGIDIICDLNKDTLPFESNSIDEIIAYHIFEHLTNWEKVLINCFNVLKDGGRIKIKTPYGAKTFQHPYHVRFFYPTTLFEFCLLGNKPKGLQLHNNVQFKLISVKVNYQFKNKLWLLKEIFVGRISYKFLKFSTKEIEWILEKPKKINIC